MVKHKVKADSEQQKANSDLREGEAGKTGKTGETGKAKRGRQEGKKGGMAERKMEN